MLREIRDVRQVPGEGRRRWFTDAYFDLVVWYAEDGTVSGFQLCYDKQGHERAFTWRKDHACTNEEMDAGEIPGHSRMSPVPESKSSVLGRGIEKRLFFESANIDDRAIVRLVCNTIATYRARLDKVESAG